MENQIKQLKISNFKSIREAELECGRINLFVGKPNTGKSNLLEALSLLGHAYATSKTFMAEFIRYEKLSNLFHFFKLESPVQITSDLGTASISHDFEKNQYTFSCQSNLLKTNDSPKAEIVMQPDGSILRQEGESFNPVKKYTYKSGNVISREGKNFLVPPFGENLFGVLQTTARLKEEVPKLFEAYGLEFLIDLEERKLALQRRQNGYVFKTPYNLISDTWRRIIFHYAAIFSNRESVLLFEEPESHSFPPFIRDMALKIAETKDNQFFIATHSPYILTPLVDYVPAGELAIFIAYFQDYESRFYKLTDTDISELMTYGIDIFFNQKWFLNE